MIDKKRLVMMAMAISMILPNNFLITPILATDPSQMEGNSETQDPQELTQENINSALDGSYILKEDIGTTTALTSPIEITGNVVIDLNGKNINSKADRVIKVAKDASLTIVNSSSTGGIISCGYLNGTGAIFGMSTLNAHLTIGPKVTLNSTDEESMKNIYAAIISGQEKGVKGSIIDVTKATIRTTNGFYVNGTVVEENAPTINLTEVDIDTRKPNNPESGSGIYQAGFSTFNVVNCTIKGDTCGIQTRAGILNVSGGTIEGGTQPVDVEPNSNGSTSDNAGISITQHNATPLPTIDVNIINAQVKGYVGLLIADPENKQTVIAPSKDPNINVVVSNSTLNGEFAAVGYTEDTIGFTLVNTKAGTTFLSAENENWVKKLQSQLINNKKYLVKDSGSLVPQTSPKGDNFPGTYILSKTDTSTPSETTALVDVDKTTLDSSIFETGSTTLLNSTGQDTVKTTLQATLNSDLYKENNVGKLRPMTEEGEGDPTSLNYTYIVEEVDKAVVTVGGNYRFQAKISATLNSESVIRLLIPYKELETAPIYESEIIDGAYTYNLFPVNVLLSDILTTESQSATDPAQFKIDSDSLKSILATIPQIDVESLDIDALAQKTFEASYPVVDTYTPISFEVKTKTSTSYIPGGSGSHKPKPKPEEPITPVIGTPTTMYRLYNRLNGEHLFTIDPSERANLLTSDTWKDEGEGWIAPSVSEFPVYRLLNPNNGDHHYTLDKNEFDTLPSYGWIAEGVAFFSADKDNAENVILHRLYNPNAKGAGSHHYTADTNERDTLVAQGWTYEGLAWAGLPANK